MSYNDDLEYASLLIQEGHKEEASRLVRDYLDKYPDDPDGWYLFAAAAPIPEYAIRHLQHALDIDPFHAKARAALPKVRAAQAREVAAAEPPEPPSRWPVVIRRIVMFVAVVLIVLLVVGVMSMFQRNKAEDQAALATAQVIMTLAASAPTEAGSGSEIGLATLPPPLLYEAPFDTATWTDLAGSAGEAILLPDALTLTGTEVNRFTSRYLTGQTFNDGAFTVRVNKVEGPLNDGAGVALRVDPVTGNHYLFVVSSDGYAAAFFCEGWCSAALTEIVPWTPLEVINQGVGAVNTIEVIAAGADFQFLVNGASVGAFNDDRQSSGGIGVGAFVFEAGSNTVRFEDVTVQGLP